MPTPCLLAKTLRRGWAALLVGLALMVAAAVPAAAHASLVGADPADGAVLSAPPARLVLTFSEPVSPLVLALVRPDGVRTALGGATLRDRTLEVAAPAGLDPGTHLLTWRVVSEDGHPVGGSVTFSIGAPSRGPEAAAGADWTVRAGLWGGKVLLYCGLFLGVGGVFARAWLGKPRAAPHRLHAAVVLLGLAGAALSLGFQGLDALGAPVGRLLDAAAWRAGAGTSFGRTLALAGLAFLLALSSLRMPSRPARWLAAAALLAAGLSLAASGHAGAAAPQWLTRPAVFVHVVAVALWTGALAPLALMLRTGGPEAADALRRFSRFIPFAVAALFAAGAVLAVVQVETPSALLDTAYGRVLLVKLALLAVLMALAAVNRWRLTAGAAGGEGAASRRLRRSIGAETAMALLIFAVAACWRFTPPPRALLAAEPAAVHIHTPEAMVEVTVAPARAGPVSASVTLMTGDFAPLSAKDVTLVMGSKAAGIEPIRRAARAIGDGSWRVDGLVLPVAGMWQLRVDVLVSDFKLLRLPAEVAIRP